MSILKHLPHAVGALAIALGGPAFAQALPGPMDDKPLTENWAPSKWGAGDRAGSANHTKNPAHIKRALDTVKQFKSIAVGKYYHQRDPSLRSAHVGMVLPGTPQGGPFGKNALVYHDDYVTTEIGQIGTQFDGPGHIGVNTSKERSSTTAHRPRSYERGAGRARCRHGAERRGASSANGICLPPRRPRCGRVPEVEGKSLRPRRCCRSQAGRRHRDRHGDDFGPW